MAIATVGFSLLRVRGSVQQFVHRQVALDRETGSAALQLRAALRTLRDSYQRLDVYRRVTLAACPVIPTPICPEVMAAFRAAARFEGVLQKLVQIHWIGERLTWNEGAGTRSDYQEFEFPIATGTEEDLLRSWTDSFEDTARTTYTLSIQGNRIRSSAEVRREGEAWHVSWKE